MYQLFTDKQEIFEADIKLEGASLNDSFARLVVESEDWNLVFKGEINENGHVNIPIKKLKQIFPNGTTGNMKLEVVAEDTYFTPWESDFEVETSKQVTVEVKSQNNKNKLTEKKTPRKPTMTVERVSKPIVKSTKSNKTTTNKPQLFKEYVGTLKRVNINLDNLSHKQKSLQRLTEAFTNKHKLSDTDKEWLKSQTLKYFVNKSGK